MPPSAPPAPDEGPGRPIPAAVAQVLDDDGRVAGAAFLISGDRAVTCAHVVRAAGRGPGDRLRLAFPHLDGAPTVEGEVLAGPWRPAEAEDIAVVQLAAPPAGARPLALDAAAGSRGHRVSAFGFPAQAPPGGHFGYGIAGDLLPGSAGNGPVLQLTGANDLTTGFSGGPLLDEVTGRVIGMVTAIAAPDAHLKGLGIAYATPTETLRAAWPELSIQEVSPYRLLEPFTAEHARWFHGRDSAVERVVDALRAQPVLLLLGPSGAGKSSLVQAGVLSALAGGALPDSDRWLPVVARPGRDLPAELERAGLPGVAADGIVAAAERRLAAEPTRRRLLLVIDQFEELLTQEPDGERPTAADQAIQARLLEAIGTGAPLGVILIMRDDFYPRLAALFPELLDAAIPGLVNIPATLSVDDLHAIVTRPAETAGARFEEGLADRIITDILAADPMGSTTRQAPVTLLPALELTLSRLWERRRDGYLTHDAYQRLGKVTGSLTTWCDSVFDRLDAGDRVTARRVLTALVRPMDETRQVPAARQQVPVAALRELATDPRQDGSADHQAAGRVLEHLTRSRIIIGRGLSEPDGGFGEPVAELVHEALIRDWARLREWIAQDHRFQDWLRRAEERRTHWLESGNPGDLLRGTDLADGLRFAEQRSLPSPISAFLAASRQRQRAAARRRKRIRAAFAGFLALLLAATGITIWQQRVAAERQALIASREAAAVADTTRPGDPATALQLSLAAYRIAPTPQARISLLASLGTPYPTVLRLAGKEAPGLVVRSVVFAPGGGTLATSGNDAAIRLWNVSDPRHPTRRTMVRVDSPSAVAFSPDGRLLAAQTVGAFWLWDVTDPGRPVLKAKVGSPGFPTIAFAPDGTKVATAGEAGTLRVWDVRDPARPAPRLVHVESATVSTGLAFSPDGTTLAATGRTAADDGGKGQVWLWDLKDPRKPMVSLDVHSAQGVAFSPRGDLLAAGGAQGALAVWNVGDPRHPTTVDSPAITNKGDIMAIAFAADGGSFVAADRTGAVQRWTAERYSGDLTLERTSDLPNGFPVSSVGLSPDGRFIAGGDESGTVRFWNTVGASIPGRPGTLVGVDTSAFSPDGGLIAVSRSHAQGSGLVQIWDLRDVHRPVLAGALPRPWTQGRFLRRGRTLLTRTDDRSRLALWDVTDPRRPRMKSSVSTGGWGIGIADINVTPDERTLLFTDLDRRTVSIFDITDAGHPVRRAEIPFRTPAAHSTPYLSALVSDSVLLTQDDDGMHLWDIRDLGRPKRLGDLAGRDGGAHLRIAELVEEKRRLFLWSKDRGALVWSLDDPRRPVTPDNAAAMNGGDADSLDDSTLAVLRENDQSVTLWDVGGRDEPRPFRALPAPGATSVTAGDAGRMLALTSDASRPRKVQLWDLSERDQPLDLGPLALDAIVAEFGPDGRTLALLRNEFSSRPEVLLMALRPDEVYRHLCSVVQWTITPERWDTLMRSNHPYTRPCDE
ncbi:hypothetical protein Sru01_07010 [Sphaerisporangium rufum]|uniref:Novel STAND NTPase 1 domain-containing protein n=1 Tax=Sphaerisporangium rufum TaxID=1381558 RepID=A0A919UXD2_9ACTN|nr:trypsin-like peptidase domain-containing protein [Sphaerisporangium rufum]GII75719.1 hypothetical protein Sru01_07010 [Sphaerisporangium rufum]